MTGTTEKKFLFGNVSLLICAMVCLLCYDSLGGLGLKGVTSSWFVLLGGLNLVYARKCGIKLSRFLIFVELGLFCGMCADVLLGIEFLLGVLFFALGHVLYLAAFYALEKFRVRDLYLILPIAALSLFLVTGTPYIRVEDAFMKKLMLGYAVLISCMLGKAASNACAGGTVSRKLILLGSAMFLFSDLMLAVDLFGQPSRLTWILCSYTYWPAQNLLAFSLFYFVNEQRVGEKKASGNQNS